MKLRVIFLRALVFRVVFFCMCNFVLYFSACVNCSGIVEFLLYFSVCGMCSGIVEFCVICFVWGMRSGIL